MGMAVYHARFTLDGEVLANSEEEAEKLFRRRIADYTHEINETSCGQVDMWEIDGTRSVLDNRRKF